MAEENTIMEKLFQHLDEKAKTINIEDKINTDLYKQALEETKEKYGKEDPKFYESLEKFFEENDK